MASTAVSTTATATVPALVSASTKAATKKPLRSSHETGKHIFIYCHVQTKQTLYSLSRAMNPNHVLKQIPFLGKQTQQHNIRKDFWRPLATVTFPNGHQGLEAYRQLREFKVRHEHEWTMREVGARINHDIQGRPHYDLYDAGRKVRNQKANSIADLAFVLALQKKLATRHAKKDAENQKSIEEATTAAQTRLLTLQSEMRELRSRSIKGDTAALAAYKALKVEKVRIKRHLQAPRPDAALKGVYHPLNDRSVLPKFGLRRSIRLKAAVPRFEHGTRVAWADPRDANYAKEWPETIAHDEMLTRGQRDRNVHEHPSRLEQRLAESGVDTSAAPEDLLTPEQRQAEIEAEEKRQEEQAYFERTGKRVKLRKREGTWDRIVQRLAHGAQ